MGNGWHCHCKHKRNMHVGEQNTYSLVVNKIVMNKESLGEEKR